jgi:choline dehydrogenase-like flavoprotein
MGLNSSSAVCDSDGNVFGTESIYVCDASLFPTSVEVNPYETVMLLAKHVAERLKQKINEH